MDDSVVAQMRVSYMDIWKAALMVQMFGFKDGTEDNLVLGFEDGVEYLVSKMVLPLPLFMVKRPTVILNIIISVTVIPN